jgi:hypothetical protein
MDEEDLTFYLKKIYEDRFRCFEHCKICENCNDTHYANCMECCPVRSGKIKSIQLETCVILK